MILLLWPTIRPGRMKSAYKVWLNRAHNSSNICVKIAVNTKAQRAQLAEFNDVIIIGNGRRGAAYATWMLSKDVRLNDSDIVILASDDFVPPKNWDKYIRNKLNKDACLVVNDGYQYGGAITIPIMTYGCLKRLNHIIYHPSYHHQYSDAELYDNVAKLGMMLKCRDKKEPMFEHQHWANGKRKLDDNDVNNNKFGGHDHKNYQKRQKLPLGKKLKVGPEFYGSIDPKEEEDVPFSTSVKIHRITSMDDIKANRDKWHPFYDKTGNIENYFSKWFNKNIKSVPIEEADFIYLPIRFVDFFKVYATGQHHPDYSKIRFIIDRFNTDHFKKNSHKYFTVCQWVKGTCMDLGNAIKFMATATDKNHISIPLCTDEHPKLDIPKEWLASFVGNINNCNLRKRMANISKKYKYIKVAHGISNLNGFRKLLSSSYFNLCPKGIGPASFRIFESFHVGAVPVIISDNYIRPYADKVNWDDFSITIREKDIEEMRDIMMSHRDHWQDMSIRGMKFYRKYCTRPKVCENIIKKLEEMR